MYFIIAATALLASILTFFSGFGLGTILLPVFALFFDLPTAILLTAIVHFLNNVFKFLLVGKKINKKVFLSFGLPSLIAAFAGAWCLSQISVPFILFSYPLGGHTFSVSGLGLLIGLLMIFFALWEVLPYFKNLSFSENKVMAGGFLSGFFGGLTGHQGALRTAFLIRLKLEKETFVATGIAVACLVDAARMAVYATSISSGLIHRNYQLIICAVLSAWVGAFIGNKLIKKTTYNFIKWFVLVFMIAIALLVATGILNK